MKKIVDGKKIKKELKELEARHEEKVEQKRHFSREGEIKLYYGKDNIVPGSLVLEGGAFRGLYTAGVLDCLIDNDINMARCAGISAGGLNGTNYLAGCRGRSGLGILMNRYNPEYVGAEAVVESGSVVGFKVMFEDFNKIQQLNEERLFGKERELSVGCTNMETGEIEYFSSTLGKDTFFKALRATASMPLLSKMVKIGNNKYLDGGCHSKFPIDYALENNWEKIVVVSTRPLSYRRKEVPSEYKVEKVRYRKYPKFLESCLKSNTKYNEDCEKMQQLQKEGKIFVIEPSETVNVSRLEKDMEKLGSLYELGYKDANKLIPELKKYLGLETEEEKVTEVYKKPTLKDNIKKIFSSVTSLFHKKK